MLHFLCRGIDEQDPGKDGGLCDVNVKDENGWAALHFAVAASANSVMLVRALSNHGAQLTVETDNGDTPFHWAKRLSNTEAAAELERLGAVNGFYTFALARFLFWGSASILLIAGRCLGFKSQ